MPGRPKGSKNKNKKSLIQWLDGHGWRFEEKFREAYAESSPEERLRFIGKCLPFLFQRVDNTPLVEGDVNIHVKGIDSKKELMKAIMGDPMMDMQQVLDAEVIEVKGESNGTRENTKDRLGSDEKTDNGSERDNTGSPEEGTGSTGGEESSSESGERDSQ